MSYSIIKKLSSESGLDDEMNLHRAQGRFTVRLLNPATSISIVSNEGSGPRLIDPLTIERFKFPDLS
jgi:hypothetical protein